MVHRAWVVGILASGLLTVPVPGAAAAPVDVQAAHARSQAVPGRYIVVLRDDVPAAGAVAADLASRLGLGVTHVFEHALKGFAGSVPSGLLAVLQADPRVAYIEADQTVFAFAQTVPTGIRRIFADGNANLDIDGSDDARIDADVAVLDTGIAAHADLNVVARADCTTGSTFFASGCTGNSGSDGNGHGTHVAGTIGALDNGSGVVGVAPGVRLWSVKVLGDNGSGYISWIVSGVDWVTARAGDIEVANMSLGCECSSSALDDAITRSVAAGIVYAVAAGNSAKDIRTFTPARHPDVIAVSALADFNGAPGGGAAATCRSDEDDTLANFSNFGAVHLAAPGVCIVSTWRDGGYATLSGTSMATPHVAGAAALLASMSKPRNRDDVLSIRATLRNTGNLDWVDQAPDGVKEPLLDVSSATVFQPTLTGGSSGGGGEEPPPPPAVLAMGVYRINWSSGFFSLDITINARSDSDASGTLASNDPVVAGATVSFELIHDRSGDGGYDCGAGDQCWTFSGNTDSNGNFRGRLLNAPRGNYQARVTSLRASGKEWDPSLDVENPERFRR